MLLGLFLCIMEEPEAPSSSATVQDAALLIASMDALGEQIDSGSSRLKTQFHTLVGPAVKVLAHNFAQRDGKGHALKRKLAAPNAAPVSRIQEAGVC